MEKADSDVTTALQRGLLPLKNRMKIAVDVANGLKAIHSAHYVEQDIKADSILVSLQTRECVFLSNSSEIESFHQVLCMLNYTRGEKFHFLL